ncbi:hypothetical protein ACFL5H_01170 [Candidatus Latescibacterota bacterium]
MNHVAGKVIGSFLACFLLFSSVTYAQNIYELRRLTDQEWLSMSTRERLTALGASNAVNQNQTFVGDFSQNTDLYPAWGYDFYEMEDRYENYAFRGFENYRITNDRRNRWFYNQFGDRLTRMTRAGQIWFERFNADGTYGQLDQPTRGSGGNPTIGPNGYINDIRNVRVTGAFYVQESTDDWAASVVGAAALRKKLTPLTFSLPNFHGMAIDFQSDNYQATFLSHMPVGMWSRHQEVRHGSTNYMSVLMLRGGQIRRKFGALTLGANYAAFYNIAPARDDGNKPRGTVGDATPAPHLYLVRVLDDSPWNGDGPTVYDVKLYVNGEYRPDFIPMVFRENLYDEQVSAVTDLGQIVYNDFMSLPMNRFGYDRALIDQTTLNETQTKYIDYLHMIDYIKGRNLNNLTTDSPIIDIERAKQMMEYFDPAGKPVQVNGAEYVTYIFDLSGMGNDPATDWVTGVKADITVGGDYKIQFTTIYCKEAPVGRDDVSGGNYFKYFGGQYWKTAALAEGNTRDNSNVRTVTVEWGFDTSVHTYGLEAHFNYLGFRIDSEYVINKHYFQYADGNIGDGVTPGVNTDITSRKGDYSSISDNAYYITMQKDWEEFGFAGEIFKMGKFYSPQFHIYASLGEYGGQSNVKGEYMRLTMIEDNDDNDQYPDYSIVADGSGYRYGNLPDGDGVFPGRDLDRDSIPDTDKNLNGVPDYNEPFLMFDTDPDEFIFGDDWNNNTRPDIVEDDLKDDTPYDLDRQGYHFNFHYSPLRNLRLELGTLNSHEVSTPLRNNNNYFKTIYTFNILDLGNMYIEYRYERIKDNISDPYIIIPVEAYHPVTTGDQRYSFYSTTEYPHALYYDEIEYRNSKVNRLFVESNLRPTSAITINNHVRYDHNGQIEGVMYDGVYQKKDTVKTLAMSNYIVYAHQIGNFTISPGIKFRLYKKAWETFESPRDHYLVTIPLVTFRYTVTDRTAFTLGFQGFPNFETRYDDLVLDRNSYRQKNTIFQLDNVTNYFGFEIWGALGFSYEQISYDTLDRKFEEYKQSALFCRMWMGY